MSSTFLPKVSIVIPVYNGSNYVGEAIDSALAQTYTNFEVIVVNDGSTDNGKTEEIALSYGDKIRYFKKENGGVSSALNFGISMMTGEYFSWLSHDDKYEPYKLEHLVAALSKIEDRKKVIAISGVYFIDFNSKKIKDGNSHLIQSKIYSGREMLDFSLEYGVLNGCAMLIPKTAFDECGGFDEELRYNQDGLKWNQMFFAEYSLLADTQNKDVMHRLHAMQDSKRRRDLLLSDSVKNSKIIAPYFIAISTKKNNYFKRYTQRWARLYCNEAVKECIHLGREAKIFSFLDVLELEGCLLLGMGRNILKKAYHKLVFRIK